MPRHKSAKLLREICLDNVVKNMDEVWCADYRDNYFEEYKFRFIIGPFDHVDADSAKDVLRKLSEENRMSRVYLHLLIIPTITEIDLSLAAKYVNNEIVDLLCIRCKNIRSINLSQCVRVTCESLSRLVNRFESSLQSLSLKGLKLNSTLLNQIGTLCFKLEILNIDRCKVTRKGMDGLLYSNCGKDETLSPVAKSLRVLQMFGCSFQGDVGFITKLLQNCPQIVSVNHFELWEAIFGLFEKGSQPHHLNLTSILYDMMLFRDLKKHITKIPMLALSLPHIQHLCLCDVSDIALYVYDLISVCGNTLKTLVLEWGMGLGHLHYIGALCPHLNSLQVTVAEQLPVGDYQYRRLRDKFDDYLSAHKLPDAQNPPWCGLSHLAIYGNPDTHDLINPMALSVFKDIFEACSLALMSLHLVGIHDNHINVLIQWWIDKNKLTNIKQLLLTECFELTASNIWQLLIHAPSLNHLDITSCQNVSLSDYNEFRVYIRDHNLDMKLVSEWDIS